MNKDLTAAGTAVLLSGMFGAPACNARDIDSTHFVFAWIYPACGAPLFARVESA